MENKKTLTKVIPSVELLDEMEALVVRGGYDVAPMGSDDPTKTDCLCVKAKCPTNQSFCECIVIVGGQGCLEKP